MRPFFIMMLLAGCTSSVCKGEEIHRATTASAEAAAMTEFWRECSPVSLSAYDSSGAPVPFSNPNWPQRVHRLDIGSDDGPTFSHQVIDATNVTLMMGE